MTRNIFKQRKKDVLFKDDKSFKKSWDEKIVKLCEKINSLENYYTTSSCSGRIVLMVNQDKKDRDLFVKVYHDLISFDELKNDLNIIIKQNEKSIKLAEDIMKSYPDSKSAQWVAKDALRELTSDKIQKRLK